MKTLKAIKLCALIIPAMLLGMSGLATAEVRAVGADDYLSGKPANVMHANDLIGKDVKSKSNDETIGSIDDLIIDKDGRIVGAVVGIGGFLGIGDKNVAVAWDALEVSTAENGEDFDIRLDADRQSLENAVEYEAK